MDIGFDSCDLKVFLDMNVVFLTMVPCPSLAQRGIYSDLLRQFVANGHKVYVIYPYERRLDKDTEAHEDGATHFLGVRTLNLQKSSTVEKGIGQVLVDFQFKKAIMKYWKDEKFDLILYSTPPITLTGVVKYLKKKNPSAKSYLLLKDIFPQNAVDLGMMVTTGLKSLLYKYFRKKEKELYKLSDYIGCMSPANVEYLLSHNPEISKDRVEVAPNSIELVDEIIDNDRNVLREFINTKYNIPIDKPIFIYGGNLGKPQGIDYIIKCLDAIKDRKDCYFVLVGNGTEYHKLVNWYEWNKGCCVPVAPGMPKDDYDMLVRACDVGLIFLDHRFTIPNYPSRLLSYMENKMPVICATDVNTDIGKIAEAYGYGFLCESVEADDFTALVDKMLHSDIKQMGANGYHYLKENFLVNHTYNTIIKHFNV